MGFTFEMKHASLVAFVTVPWTDRPLRLKAQEIAEFLEALCVSDKQGGPLISSRPDWIQGVRKAASECRRRLAGVPKPEPLLVRGIQSEVLRAFLFAREFLAPEAIDNVLGPLIAKFSALKIQTATTDLIDTYNPAGPGEFGCKVNRIQGHVSTRYSVDCFISDSHGAGVANRSAHLLAYYIRVGEPVPERLVSWRPGVLETPYGAVCQEEDDLDRLARAGNTIH